MGPRLFLTLSGLAAVGIFTATAAARAPTQDIRPIVDVNRTAKADRQAVTGGTTVLVKSVSILPGMAAIKFPELLGCEPAVSPLADRLASRQFRHCDT
jgi:hypothetical protein